jgi:hypothetical protein
VLARIGQGVAKANDAAEQQLSFNALAAATRVVAAARREPAVALLLDQPSAADERGLSVQETLLDSATPGAGASLKRWELLRLTARLASIQVDVSSGGEDILVCAVRVAIGEYVIK